MNERFDGAFALNADVCPGLCEEARDGPASCALVRRHRRITAIQKSLLNFGPAAVLFAAGLPTGNIAASLIGAGASLAASPILTRLLVQRDNDDAAGWPATWATALLSAGLMVALGAPPLVLIPAAVLAAAWPDAFHKYRSRFFWTQAERCASRFKQRSPACACPRSDRTEALGAATDHGNTADETCRRLDAEIATAIADENAMTRFGILRRANGSSDDLFYDSDFRAGELRSKRQNHPA